MREYDVCAGLKKTVCQLGGNMPPPHWVHRARQHSNSNSSLPSWAKRSRSNRLSQKPCLTVRKWSRTLLQEKLASASLPVFWTKLVLRALSNLGGTETALVGVEVFSGEHRLTTEMQNIVGDFETFEILDSPAQNITDANGVVLLLQKILRVVVNGFVWFAVPCSSWVCLSRSFTMRSHLQPAGPPKKYTSAKQRTYLDMHNSIADTVALVIRTLRAIDVDFIIEQPVSSMLFHYEPIRSLVAGTFTVPFQMQNFCGDTPKPLILKGSPAWLQTFSSVAQLRHGSNIAIDRLTVPGRKSDGTNTFSGKTKHLKRSSGYTYSMGVAIACCYLGESPNQVLSHMRAVGVA